MKGNECEKYTAVGCGDGVRAVVRLCRGQVRVLHHRIKTTEMEVEEQFKYRDLCSAT